MMRHPREHWFFEGGVEDDCKSLHAASRAARESVARREWSKEDEFLEVAPEEGARLLGAAIIVSAVLMLLIVALYFIVISQQSVPSWKEGLPIDEKLLKDLPARPDPLRRVNGENLHRGWLS